MSTSDETIQLTAEGDAERKKVLEFTEKHGKMPPGSERDALKAEISKIAIQACNFVSLESEYDQDLY
jgi:hypothetical protein